MDRNRGGNEPGNKPGADTASAGQGAAEQARQKAGEALDQAQQKAGQVAGQVQQQARPRLEGQKEHAAHQVSAAAQALRQTGQQMREQGQGNVGQYADRGAEQIERLSGYLRDHDLDELINDAEQLARRQPALFLAGTFALGLLGARFLKSSRQRREARRM